MNKSVAHHIAAAAQSLGFLDEVKYRDFCIKEEFEELRGKEDQRKTTDEIEIFLGEKYCLDPGYIHQILYKK